MSQLDRVVRRHHSAAEVPSRTIETGGPVSQLGRVVRRHHSGAEVPSRTIEMVDR